MTISSGLKEFADGNAALFNGNHFMEGYVENHLEIELKDDFEYEFHRMLTESTFQMDTSITNNHSSFDSNAEDLYSTPPDIMKYEAIIPQNTVKFEEDPLSAILNIEQLQQTQTEQEQQPKNKKRGRPPIIKFKPSTEYTTRTINPKAIVKSADINLLHQQKLELRERRSDDDNYSPVWIRGRGVEREGLCPLCEPPHWFKIKQSAYWYHMNFYHGISAATGKPYKRPISYRSTSSNKVEGHCGNCLQWVLLASDFKGTNQSDLEEGVSFAAWYKHAQKCHYRTKEFRIPF